MSFRPPPSALIRPTMIALAAHDLKHLYRFLEVLGSTSETYCPARLGQGGRYALTTVAPIVVAMNRSRIVPPPGQNGV